MTVSPLRLFGLVAACGLAVASAQAQTQRDPAYAAARAAGTVGEKPDGYLASLGGGTQAMVDDLNIRRRALYTDQARAESVTVDQVAFVAGCRNIARTVPGEKYQAPDGAWQTRGAGAPTRDARCI